MFSYCCIYSLLHLDAAHIQLLLQHPDEVYQLYRYLSSQPDPSNRLKREGDEAYCFDVLAKVSRSFAMVIEGLTDDLRSANTLSSSTLPTHAATLCHS